MLNFAVTADMGEHSTESAGSTHLAGDAVLKLAQGITCGKLNLAFTFDWARQIVDSYELVSLPRAPSWVLGAVNINGVIVPVVDLSNYFSESNQPAQNERGQRLLVGGIRAEDSEAALAVVFSQTPVQLEFMTQPIGQKDTLSRRLLEVCRGIAQDDRGKQYREIDPVRLMGALSIELSVI